MNLFKYSLLNLKRILIKSRTKLFFYFLVISKKYRNYHFKKYFLKYNPNYKENNSEKKNVIMIWEERFKYLKSQIIEDDNVNLIIIPRIFLSPGFQFFLRNYHIKKSRISPKQQISAWQILKDFKRERLKFRKYCNQVLLFINSLVKIDLILLPKCNDDWTIDFIKVINKLNIKLFIDDREGAVTPQRLMIVPPLLKNIGISFDLMTTQNEFHKKFFIDAGFLESKIIINGAPQSDYWYKKIFWQNLSEIESSLRKDLIKILFFSFGERTYMNFYYGNEKRTWMPLIKDVNDVLIQILNKYEGKIQLIIKTGAKMNRDINKDGIRFFEKAKKHIDSNYVLFLDASKSSFDLMRQSQLVVGFQTSGMIEAMNTSNQIIYTAWGDFYKEIENTLLPLANEKCLDICSSKKMFFETLEKGIIRESKKIKYNNFSALERKKLIEKYFSYSDGNVSKRLADLIYKKI